MGFLEEYFNDFFKQDDEVILKSEALLPLVVEQKIQEGKIVLKNIKTDSSWFGITYKEDLEGLKKAINELVSKGEYPSKLWE